MEFCTTIKKDKLPLGTRACVDLTDAMSQLRKPEVQEQVKRINGGRSLNSGALIWVG